MAVNGDAPRSIISASLNADIPADCGAWFMRRLDEGYCLLPRREGLQFRRVSLAPEAVAGFVFWTRSIGNFGRELEEIARRGFAFVVQFAITGYRARFDPSPIEVAHAVEQARSVALRFGERVLVWRYDPLIIADETTADWHVANFEHIAGALRGATDEVVVAFATRASSPMRAPRHRRVSSVQSPRRRLLGTLAPIAKRNGLRLSVCADPDALVPGCGPARCIDAERLKGLSGLDVAVPTTGFRPGCLCARAIDVGDRPGPAKPFFCGARRRVARGYASASEAMLYPMMLRFPCPSGEDLPF